MTVETKAVIAFHTHHCVVTVLTDGTVKIFKYSESLGVCEWEVFTDHDSAGDYILAQPDPLVYYVSIEGEEPLHRI